MKERLLEAFSRLPIDIQKREVFLMERTAKAFEKKRREELPIVSVANGH